ncbi:MAG: DNA adenine methylase [Rhodospirillales bacterium]|nr:DNA adenine methylase [Rhodospirillales bacterium]
MNESQKRLVPHPIPYQGSKRALAPLISKFVPSEIEVWYEPFAGSAAMTLWAAANDIAHRYVIGDSLEPICELWKQIVFFPDIATLKYAEIWNGQAANDHSYFNQIRDRYNKFRDPIDLLYLICRCVKNAVRFNRNGAFTQSVDKRRLGMKPEKMKFAIFGASSLLKGRTEIRCGDWQTTVNDASKNDFVYMDPPYQGTSVGKDKRYAHQITAETLAKGLEGLNEKNLRFALSYDGMTGEKSYGPPLPEHLGLVRLMLHAGTSSQATLSGRNERTIESLYLSAGLGEPYDGVISRTANSDQHSLNFVAPIQA